MRTTDYPALFQNADAAATKRQRLYFRFLILQFCLLFLASAATLASPLTSRLFASGFYLVCVLLAATALLFSVLKAPEQDWYITRALAESVKTLTWRYMMGSEPFNFGSGQTSAEHKFSKFLSDLLAMNSNCGNVLSHSIAPGAQITEEMGRRRLLSFDGRHKLYLDERVEDQLQWYQRKAMSNRKMATLMARMCAAVYAIAIAIAIVQFYFSIASEQTILLQWVTEPVLVLAASFLGWMQAKRYSELAASYTLAFHEISKLKGSLSRVKIEAEFVDVVLEAETAFSREHTQWVARQSSI